MTIESRQHRTPSKRRRPISSDGQPEQRLQRQPAQPPFTLLSSPVPDINKVIAIRPHVDAGHPHPKRGARDAADLKRYQPLADDGRTPKQRNRINLAAFLDERRSQYHQAALARSLSLLPVDLRKPEVEIFDEYVALADELAPELVAAAGGVVGGDPDSAPPAIRDWAAQRAHEDMAAAILSVGGSQVEAALYAGVTPSTVARMLRNPEFTQRVTTERRRLLSRVQGGVLAELERRVFSGDVLLMETKDVLDIVKRTAELGGDEVVAPRERAGGSGSGVHNGAVNVYSQLTQIATGGPLSADNADTGHAHPVGAGRDGRNAVGTATGGDSRAEGGDIPLLELGGYPVAATVPPIDR